MAYCFLDSVGSQGVAVDLLRAGIEANPQSFLLNLKLCELLEQVTSVLPS
jgi:hypothetical protein